jgi:hypothetical protein
MSDPAATKTRFTPPDAEQFEAHLRAFPPSPMSKWQVRAPLLVAAGFLGMSLATSGPVSAVLPWLGLGWLLGHNWARARRAMSLEAQVRGAQEVAMQRLYPRALREAWRLLPQVTPAPNLHSQTVAMIAHCLDSLGCYDAAIVGYDYLVQRLPAGEPITVHLGVSRANAALGADRLSDADDTIRRLRGAVEPFPGTPISAGYRLARLAQQVRTHHFAEGAQENADLVEALRPLGVEAGYGHALMALCHYRMYEGLDAHDTAAGPSAQDSARLWWDRATLLLPIDALLKRYPELEPLAEIT